MSDPTEDVHLDDVPLWDLPDSEDQRNHLGALPGYCPCGNGLSFEEMDWNNGLCDACAAEEEDDEAWDDIGPLPPMDDEPAHLTEDGVPLAEQIVLDELADIADDDDEEEDERP